MGIVDKVLIAQYESLYKNKRYGVSGHEFLPHIQVLIAELRPDSILNYGCGQTKQILPNGQNAHCTINIGKEKNRIFPFIELNINESTK